MIQSAQLQPSLLGLMTTLIYSAPAKQRDPGFQARVSLLPPGLIASKYDPELAAGESIFQTCPVIRYNRALSHHLIIQSVGSVRIVWPPQSYRATEILLFENHQSQYFNISDQHQPGTVQGATYIFVLPVPCL